MRLSTRLVIAMAGLAVLACVGTGYLVYRQLTGALDPIGLTVIQSHAARLGADLISHVRSARADVLAVRGTPAVDGIVQARLAGGVDPRDGTSEALWKDRLAAILIAQLQAKPEITQFRFIGQDDGGRELVRVDRSGPGGATRRVPEEELQPKGDRVYFGATLSVAEGETYISPIELNRERGVIQTPPVPMLRAATPVRAAGGKPFGILVLNCDMRPALGRLRERFYPQGRVYLVNDRGDYLVHPDRSREFASEFGRSEQWQDDFPLFAETTAFAAGGARIIRHSDGSRAFAATALARLADGPTVQVIETVPYDVLAAPWAPARRGSLLSGLAAALCAIVLATILARSLTGPLTQMTQAVESFGRGSAAAPPVDAAAEVGTLARAFARIFEEIREKTEALQRQIEERTRAERGAAELAESNARYRAVIESTDDAVVTKDLEGTITGWNPAAERLYGYSPGEAIGKGIELLVPEDRREELREILQRLRRGESIDHFETIRRTRDGRKIEVFLTISPIKTPAGGIAGASTIARDITEQKISEARFHAAVESCPSGMIMVDASGVMLLANTEIERQFGYSREELIGNSIDLLVPSRLKERHPILRQGFMADPSARAMGAGRDLQGRRKDGSEFPVEIGLNPLRMRDSLAVLAVVNDITLRKRAEAERARHVEELRRSNSELEQFAYVASHDLQEPLRMIVSYTELLSQRFEGQLDERAGKYIRYAVEGGRRMQQLINDLLAYSRIGTQGRSMEPVDPEDVLREALASLSRVIEESRAEIVSEPLPRVVADGVQLGQVFQNLIGNGIKFRGESPPRIHIGARMDAGEVEFSVADNGIGIDAAHSNKVFQMFQRLHERGRYEGSGIGLALAKKIVERHGGRIWFESSRGRGTTFHFTMRAVTGEDA